MSLILQLHCSRSLPYDGPHVNIYGTDTDSNSTTLFSCERTTTPPIGCLVEEDETIITRITAIPIAR